MWVKYYRLYILNIEVLTSCYFSKFSIFFHFIFQNIFYYYVIIRIIIKRFLTKVFLFYVPIICKFAILTEEILKQCFCVCSVLKNMYIYKNYSFSQLQLKSRVSVVRKSSIRVKMSCFAWLFFLQKATRLYNVCSLSNFLNFFSIYIFL